MTDLKNKKLLIVSNRLPVNIKKLNGHYEFQRSVGGLATGLINLFKKNNINIFLKYVLRELDTN